MEAASLQCCVTLKLSALWETQTRVSSIVNYRTKKSFRQKRSRRTRKLMQVKYRIPTTASCLWSTSFKSQKKIFRQVTQHTDLYTTTWSIKTRFLEYILKIQSDTFIFPSLLDKNAERRNYRDCHRSIYICCFFLIIKGEMRDLPSFCPFKIRSPYLQHQFTAQRWVFCQVRDKNHK